MKRGVWEDGRGWFTVAIHQVDTIQVLFLRKRVHIHLIHITFIATNMNITLDGNFILKNINIVIFNIIFLIFGNL